MSGFVDILAKKKSSRKVPKFWKFSTLCVTADNHRWISDLFKLADTNNDGAVDLEEFRVAEEAREYKHKLFLELMGEAEKAHPEGLTEGQFCDLAGKKLTDKLVMEVQKKNKSL